MVAILSALSSSRFVPIMHSSKTVESRSSIIISIIIISGGEDEVRHAYMLKPCGYIMHSDVIFGRTQHTLTKYCGEMY